jgi:hypothetical protein
MNLSVRQIWERCTAFSHTWKLISITGNIMIVTACWFHGPHPSAMEVKIVRRPEAEMTGTTLVFVARAQISPRDLDSPLTFNTSHPGMLCYEPYRER